MTEGARALTARGEERRNELIATAVRLFAAHGVAETSVSKIVDEVGVGKGVFYWYFPSKEALVDTILAEAMVHLREEQRAGLADAADPLGRIAEGMRSTMRWYAAHADEARLFEWARTSEVHGPTLARGREVALADIERHVRAAVSLGQIPAGHPSLRAEAVLGIASELAGGIVERRGLDPDVVADQAVRFVLAGLEAG